MEESKLPIGRPSKYKPEYCEQVIEHMSQGKSLLSFACSINVHRETVYQWARTIPDFSDALSLAKQKCEMWWQEQAIEGLWNVDGEKKLNNTNWVFNMKNRFGWRDSVEQTVEHKEPIKVTLFKDKE